METAIIKAACAIGAGLCMGIGAIGPALGEGNAVGKALDGPPSRNGQHPAYQHDPGLRHHRVDRYLLSGRCTGSAVHFLRRSDTKGGDDP